MSRYDKGIQIRHSTHIHELFEAHVQIEAEKIRRWMAFRVAPQKNEMERIYKETEWVGEQAHEASNVPLNPRSKEIMMTFQSSVVYIVIICMHQLKVVPLRPIHWRVCCCGYTVKGIVMFIFSPCLQCRFLSLSFPLPVCTATCVRVDRFHWGYEVHLGVCPLTGSCWIPGWYTSSVSTNHLNVVFKDFIHPLSARLYQWFKR